MGTLTNGKHLNELPDKTTAILEINLPQQPNPHPIFLCYYSSSFKG